MTDEEMIRRAADETSAAIGAKDADGALKHYAPGVLRFDIAPPLAATGDAGPKDRAAMEQWFATWDGPIGHELHQVQVQASGDLALVTALVHMTGNKPKEGALDMWLRLTLGLARKADGWKVVHEHASVPMQMDGSGRAALDLKPEGVA